MADDQMDKRITVDDALADVLGMWNTRTTLRGLARYVLEQTEMVHPSPYDLRPEAIRFLVNIVQPLTPDSLDKRISFTDRPGWVAREAVPHDYATVLNTMFAMGWGSVRLEPTAPTPRAMCEAMQGFLDGKARGIALRLLEAWEREGKVHRL